MALLVPIPTLTMLPIRFKKLHFELPTYYFNFFLSMIVNFELTLIKKKIKSHLLLGEFGS